MKKHLDSCLYGRYTEKGMSCAVAHAEGEVCAWLICICPDSPKGEEKDSVCADFAHTATSAKLELIGELRAEMERMIVRCEEASAEMPSDCGLAADQAVNWHLRKLLDLLDSKEAEITKTK